VQNADGSWSPYFLSARGTSSDEASTLRSTGRILEWLTVSLPDKQIEDSRVVTSVDYLIRLLDSVRYQWNVPQLSTREIASLGHALHALTVYDERAFKPADVKEPADKKPSEAKPTAEKPQAATARRNVAAPKSRS
jgi:hypothetical protein